MRDLRIKGKIVIFKSSALSKIVNLALIKTLPIFTVEQLNITIKTKNKNKNQKQNTLPYVTATKMVA